MRLSTCTSAGRNEAYHKACSQLKGHIQRQQDEVRRLHGQLAARAAEKREW